jgi:hypothetical protein
MATELLSGFLGPAQRLLTELSSNEVRLVPYAKLEDGWSLPDEFLYSLAVQMVREGSFHLVFYDGTITTPEAFLETMQKPANVPVFFFDGSEPLGFAWLNGLSGSLAFAHFAGLKAVRGRSEKVGRLAIKYWMNYMPFLNVILGITPEPNRLAIRLIQRIGFRPLGVIPGILFDAYKSERVGALVSYYTR